MNRRLVPIVVLLVFAGGAANARGDDLRNIERDLNRQFQGSALLLRSYCKGDRLVYNAKGEVAQGTALGTWTLDGRIEIKELRLKSDRIDIEGTRVFLAYDTGKKEWQGLHGSKLHIQIALPQGQLTPDSLQNLLFKVFLPRAEDTSMWIPSYWNVILEDKKPDEIRAGDRGTLNGIPIEPIDPKDCVSPPARLSTPDPPYTDQARNRRLSGLVQLEIILNKEGEVHDVLQISAPLGEDLDPKAIVTVRKWRFKPALKNNVPVPVAHRVEVSFRLYGRD